MNNERISLLESFLKSEPDDPFNRYALAMEYKTSDLQECMQHLYHLVKHFPDYLATYYQLAELLIEESKTEEAEDILKKGITLAQSQQDRNTLRELQNLLNNLLFDDD